MFYKLLNCFRYESCFTKQRFIPQQFFCDGEINCPMDPGKGLWGLPGLPGLPSLLSLPGLPGLPGYNKLGWIKANWNSASLLCN